MPYNDNRIWDSKRGWVKTKRGFRFNIRRHKPRCDVTEEELDAFLLAEDNPDFSIQGKASHKIGYTKKNAPHNRSIKHLNKVERFEKINKWLNRIPFVTVEVIE
tara:strand:+ start:106 stop:417 length:312 start_codon:yes stop_codon:yes gene_type:complete